MRGVIFMLFNGIKCNKILRPHNEKTSKQTICYPAIPGNKSILLPCTQCSYNQIKKYEAVERYIEGENWCIWSFVFNESRDVAFECIEYIYTRKKNCSNKIENCVFREPSVHMFVTLLLEIKFNFQYVSK